MTTATSADGMNIDLTSVLWIDKVCSFSTNHFCLQSQLANPSALMLTIPFRTNVESMAANERLGPEAGRVLFVLYFIVGPDAGDDGARGSAVAVETEIQRDATLILVSTIKHLLIR